MTALPLRSKLSLWFVGKIITVLVTVMLIVMATPYFFQKSWGDLTPPELFLLMLFYMIIAGAFSALVVFWLRHGLTRPIEE